MEKECRSHGNSHEHRQAGGEGDRPPDGLSVAQLSAVKRKRTQQNLVNETLIRYVHQWARLTAEFIRRLSTRNVRARIHRDRPAVRGVYNTWGAIGNDINTSGLQHEVSTRTTDRTQHVRFKTRDANTYSSGTGQKQCGLTTRNVKAYNRTGQQRVRFTITRCQHVQHHRTTIRRAHNMGYQHVQKQNRTKIRQIFQHEMPTRPAVE